MIESITFGRMHLFWPIIVVSILLWILFVWKEWAGNMGPRFLIKIVAGLIAVGALSMIALQPKMEIDEENTFSAILSPGYKIVQRDSLAKVHKGIQMIDYMPGKDLSGILKKGQEVFVLGQGLQPYDLWQLEDMKVHMLSYQIPEGITKIKYQQHDIVGNNFEVQGEFQYMEGKQQLFLMGPGGTPLDSIEQNSTERQRFTLKGKHLVEGKYVYALVTKDSAGHQLSSASLSLDIRAKRKLQILIVNQFPSFETKYLKNFLSASGHEVLVRSQVSEDRFKYEYFNVKDNGKITLDSKTLNGVDLLIIDQASLQKASKSLLQRVQEAIVKEGLGLFIQADADMYQSPISKFRFDFSKQEAKSVEFDKYPEIELSKHPFVFIRDPLLEVIHESSQGIITAYQRSGRGRFGSTVLDRTYELILNGKTNVYQELWSKLVTDMSKRAVLETIWKQNEFLIYQNAPFDFTIESKEENPIVIHDDGYRVPLMRDMDISQRWSGTVFPSEIGWNKLMLKQDSTEIFNFYVIDTSQWTSIGVKERIHENRKVANQNAYGISTAKSLNPIRPWWFFLLFLVSMTYLWIEPKL